MLKRDVLSTSNRVSLGMKCGECIHYSKGPARFEKLCSQLGQDTFSEACPEYTPDMVKVASLEKKVLVQLANVASDLSPQQTRILAFVFRNMDFIKKAGLEFGETVVFSISGQDYLDNYVRGYVLGADRTGETVYVTSDFENLNKKSAFVSLLRPALMTVEQFKQHRSALVKGGRIKEPKPVAGSNKRTILQCLKMSEEAYEQYMAKLTSEPEAYVPPQLSAVPADWLDARSVDSLVEKKGKKKDKRSNKVIRLTQPKIVNGKLQIVRYGKPEAEPSKVKPKVKVTTSPTFKVKPVAKSVKQR